MEANPSKKYSINIVVIAFFKNYVFYLWDLRYKKTAEIYF